MWKKRAAICLCAVVWLCPAATVSASPLSWSGPQLIAGQAPFGADAGGINDVSCDPSGFCAMVDDTGSVFTTSDPAGGNWMGAVVDPGIGINAISCPSAQFCVP